MADEKKETPVVGGDLAAMMAEHNKQITAMVTGLQQKVDGIVNKTKATADFSADEYKNLSATQKETAATIIADLGDEKATALKGLLKELAKPQVVVKQGSVVKDLGAPGKETRTAEEIVRDQLNNLNA